MTRLHTIDHFLMALILATLVAAVGIAMTSPDYFALRFAREDGPVENATAVFLLAASVILVYRAFRMKGRGRAMILTAIYGLMFFFAAGEEISWGQRIFEWETTEFFLENNKQDETNLHNLMVGDTHLTKTLFGPYLTVILLLYLAVLPLIYPRVGPLGRLADWLVVPVPGRRHAILAVAASLIIAFIDVERKWEVYELVFALLATSIFLFPQNSDALSGTGAAHHDETAA